MITPRKTVEKARRYRREMSLPEVLLWNALRGRRLGGLRFRRQHPVGPVVLDFYCPERRLCVEVDGAIHQHERVVSRDIGRDAWLAEQGVAVVRIPAWLVLEGVEGAVLQIERALKAPPSPAPRVLPPEREDLG